MTVKQFSPRAEIITRRTYNRPLNDEGTEFETWEQTVDRATAHQRWLWERAAGRPLSGVEDIELNYLRDLMLDRKVLMSGRCLWLGGTPTGQSREASLFNCAFTEVQTVYDCVDVLWLLLNGCGVGFRAREGVLNGFTNVIEDVEFITSTREASYRGQPENVESFEDGVWTLKIGDSAQAWAKAVGKLLAGTYPAKKLVIDTSDIRGPGERLKGYGWICAGDRPLVRALTAIVGLLNKRAECLLRRIDILDLVNWLGTILSTRRSAEIFLFDMDSQGWGSLATAKKDCFVDNPQRFQSNNSLVFETKPTREQLEHVFALMEEGGGSEPGLINGAAARQRAPWFVGVNPCGEVLLGDKSFCNLVEVDIAGFADNHSGLLRALHVAARANYRQTCVNLEDGILQESWHQNNHYLRLCGVGLTGIVRRDDLSNYDLSFMSRTATAAAMGMAKELGTPAPKNVTLIKPSGTLSKIMDTTEGLHRPLGKYIFNNINFSIHDPLVEALRAANYEVMPNPADPEAVLVKFPVAFEDVDFTVVDGTPVNLEPAYTQLERYRKYQTYWTQHNSSVTISYDLEEVPEIIDWLEAHWDEYIGVSFLYRQDPTKTAEDLGYSYLPQTAVTKEAFDAYASTLLPVDLINSLEEIGNEECATGSCPIK